MQVIHYPDYTSSNPFQNLLSASLERAGCQIVTFNANPRALGRILRDSDAPVLHLHWISGHFIRTGLLHGLVSAMVFWWVIARWRMRGRVVIWSLHELLDHDRSRVWLEKINNRVVARLAHRILVFGESVRDLASSELGVSKDKILVVYHGNYDGIVNPQPARERGEECNFLFFGRVEHYKGVPGLVEAFGKIEGPHRLRIAGRVTDPALQAQIETLAAKDPRVSLSFGFVSDEDLDGLMAWSDVIALPYRDIFTSGSLLFALTAARPVVAPDIGLIAEYVGTEAAYLYDPAQPEGLPDALRAVARDPELSARVSKAAERAAQFDWDGIGIGLARIYAEAVAGRR